MAAAVVIILRKQREIVEVFQGAGATSAATARYPSDLGIEEDRIFRGLIDRAILRDGGAGRYYLDEPSWTAHNTMRRRRSVIVLAIVIGILTFMIALGVVRLT